VSLKDKFSIKRKGKKKPEIGKAVPESQKEVIKVVEPIKTIVGKETIIKVQDKNKKITDTKTEVDDKKEKGVIKGKKTQSTVKPVVEKKKELFQASEKKFQTVEQINKASKEEDSVVSVQEKEEEKSSELVIFRIAENIFGVETEYISEILPLQYITPVPLTKEFVLGLINIRNDIFSVIDLNNLFGDDFITIHQNNLIMVLDFQDIQTGIIINKVLSISELKDNDIIHNIENLQLKYQKYMKYIVRINKDDVPVIDIRELFLSEIFNKVDKMEDQQ